VWRERRVGTSSSCLPPLLSASCYRTETCAVHWKITQWHNTHVAEVTELQDCWKQYLLHRVPGNDRSHKHFAKQCRSRAFLFLLVLNLEITAEKDGITMSGLRHYHVESEYNFALQLLTRLTPLFSERWRRFVWFTDQKCVFSKFCSWTAHMAHWTRDRCMLCASAQSAHFDYTL